MELTALLPVFTEIMKHPGEFWEKFFLITYFLVGFGLITFFVGDRHVKKLTTEMKTGFAAVHKELSEGKEVHLDHGQRISRIEKQVQEINSNRGLHA